MTLIQKNNVITDTETGSTRDLNVEHGGDGTSSTNPESPYYSRYSGGTTDTPLLKAKTESQIVSEKTEAAQGQINAINDHYKNLLAEQNVINQGRDRSTSSVNTLTGLQGSTEANIQQGKTTQLNQADNKRIQDEQNLHLQNLLGNIRTSAVEEAKQSRLEARQAGQDAIAARTARQTESVNQLSNLAKTGVTAAGLKSEDPKSYAHLVGMLGGEAQVQAMFTLNRPVETILDKRIENGKYIIAYQNPLDGKVRMETLDLGLPPQYTKTIDAGNKILAMPENWDGDPSKLITINKGLTPSEQQKANESAGGGSASTPGTPANQRLTEALTLAQSLRKDDAVGKGSAVGASLAKLVPFGQAAGLQGDRTAFEAKVSTLKSNLTLDNLKLLKGAMSDKDLLFLNSVGSSLDTGMSEASFNAELDRVITKLQTSTGSAPQAQSDPSSPPKGTDGASYGFPGYHSDGTQWVPD